MNRPSILLTLVFLTATTAPAVSGHESRPSSHCASSSKGEFQITHTHPAVSAGFEAESIWMRAKLLQWHLKTCGVPSPDAAVSAAADEASMLWHTLLERPDTAPHLLYDAILDPQVDLSDEQRHKALQRVMAHDPNNTQTWLVALQAELQNPDTDTVRIDTLLTQAAQQVEFSRGWVPTLATWWRVRVHSTAEGTSADDSVMETLQSALATSPLADVKTLQTVCAHEAVTPHRRAPCLTLAKQLAEDADSVAVQHTAAKLWAQLATDATDAMRAAQWRQELDALQTQFVALPDTPSTRALISATWIDVLQKGGREIDVQRQVLRTMSTSGTATPGSD
ncbi:MAG: hypothetical protein R3F04_00955 [Lysobacteraceae bacterium]